jgi:succinylglutamate desuccinylase
MNLPELDHLPAGLLERPASALYQQLDGPTLFHLEGRVKRPLFVSVLQHGNEITGWEAVRRLLKKHDFGASLPRSLLLFVGNIQAARHRLRRLDDQPDYNRCWPGGKPIDQRQQDLFRRIHQRIVDLDPIAAIDIHNNTGLNPHYAAVNRIRSEHLRLASLFSQKVVYFTMPPGTLSHSLSPYFPSLTLECGMAGEIHGTDHTEAFLETCLHLDTIATSRVDAELVHLYHMVATVKISDRVLFGFGRVPTDLALPENLDRYNFSELPAGTVFGDINNPTVQPLTATDPAGVDVTDRYFSFANGRITTRREIMPSMITQDRRVIQQDCLCYLMERIHYEDFEEVGEREMLPDAMRRTDRPGEPAPVR